MDLIEALETRRSIRNFQDRPVERDVIEKLITLATQAPSAMNSQPWAFVVITDKNKLQEYSHPGQRVPPVHHGLSIL